MVLSFGTRQSSSGSKPKNQPGLFSSVAADLLTIPSEITITALRLTFEG